MQKKLSISISIISILIVVFFCSCSERPSEIEEESRTDIKSDVYHAIESCVPKTAGNLVTKTKYNSDGNLQIDYIDASGNVVETYIVHEKKVLSHTLYTYTAQSQIETERTFDKDDRLTAEIKYLYESDGDFDGAKITQFKKGVAVKISYLDSDSELESYAIPHYKDGKLVKADYYENDGDLKYSFTYEYNSDGNVTKFSQYEPDGDLVKETMYEYGEGNELMTEFDIYND